MNVYWLSILEGINDAIHCSAFIAGMISVVLLIAGVAMKIESIGCEGEKEMHQAGAKLHKILCFSVPLIFILIFAGAFVPTKRDIIEAYIMIEGKGIINAENADKAIKRVDEITERILDRIGGKGDE